MNKGIALTVAFALSVANFGWSNGHEHDLVPGYDEDDYLILVEPHEITEPPYVMEVVWEQVNPSLYVADVGITLHYHEHEPMLERVSFLQVDVSPGLFGVIEGEVDPIFGIGTPGILSLSLSGLDHVHVTFVASDPSTRFLRFRLVDGLAHEDGRPLHDSLITYELLFVPEPATWLALLAGTGYLAYRRRVRA